MNKSLDQAIKSLKESPLFALSLSGKELAHSNMWAWLIEECTENNNHPFVEVFITDFYKSNYKFVRVEREKNNRDLTIWYKDEDDTEKCIVVENKIKSLPKNEQLDRYKNNLPEETFDKGILTGIEKIIDPKNPWEFLSYEEIAKRIKKINKIHKFKEKAIIKEYVDDLYNIIKIVKSDKKPNEYTHVAPPKIEELRFGDIFLKHKACKIQKIIEERIETNIIDLKSNWGNPVVDVSFHNKKATITVIYKDNDEAEPDEKKKEKGRLGVQVEGFEFRIYGGPGFQGSPYKKPEEAFKYLLSRGYFEDFNPKVDKDKKKIDGKQTGMTK